MKRKPALLLGLAIVLALTVTTACNEERSGEDAQSRRDILPIPDRSQVVVIDEENPDG